MQDNVNVRGQYASCTLRLAGHDFMDFRRNDDHTGGSDACVNFNDPDNAGLIECMQTFNLKKVYQNWCTVISLADYVVLAGEAVMGRTEPGYNATNHFASGTMLRSFLCRYHYGRTTASTCDWNVGRMPHPTEGCDGLETIFVDNIFWNVTEPWRSVAAISGAHTLGRAHAEFSGFDGHWSGAGEQGIFNNNYYRSILTKGWAPEFDMGGVSGRN